MSTPIAWNEVSRDARPRAFTLRTLRDRLDATATSRRRSLDRRAGARWRALAQLRSAVAYSARCAVDELLDVIFRWAHLIAGIMWIGNSMLFNWLDRNLEKSAQLSRLSQGKIFMVHSGAFYDVEKKLLEPGELPATLHWFKWQNFTTWTTGISLLSSSTT